MSQFYPKQSGALPNDLEFGHYQEGSIPVEMLDRITRELSDFLVSFSIDDRPSGSATLVEIKGRKGFLTAAHVITDLLGGDADRFAVICADHLHRLYVEKNHVIIHKIGPNVDDFPGPDFAFIEINCPLTLSTLNSKKSFYQLGTGSYFFEAISPKKSALCFVLGAPAEFSSEQGERQTSSHILKTTHFCARAQFNEELIVTERDYLKFDLLLGEHGFPTSYEGVSGGGIWHVQMSLDPDIGLSSLSHQRPELIAIAFYQYCNDGSAVILGQGYKAVVNYLNDVFQ